MMEITINNFSFINKASNIFNTKKIKVTETHPHKISIYNAQRSQWTERDGWWWNLMDGERLVEI